MSFEIRYGNPYAVPAVGKAIANAALKEKSFAMRIQEAKISLAARAADLAESRQAMDYDQNQINNEFNRNRIAYEDQQRKDAIARADSIRTENIALADTRLKDERAYNDTKLAEARTYNEKKTAEDRKIAESRDLQNWQNDLTLKGGVTEDDFKAAPDKYAGYLAVTHPATGKTMRVPSTSQQRIQNMREEIQAKNQMIAEQEMDPKEVTKGMVASDKLHLQTLKGNINKLKEDLSKKGDIEIDEDAETSPRYLALSTELEKLKANSGSYGGLAWVTPNDPKVIDRIKVIEDKMKRVKETYVNPYQEKKQELAELQKMHDNIQARMSDPQSYVKINDARKWITEYLKTSQNEKGRKRATDLLEELNSGSWKNALSVVDLMRKSRIQPGNKSGTAIAAK